MKIAIIAHSLHPIRQPYEGGLEMITHLLCSSLMEMGHTVHLFGHPDSDRKFKLFPLNRPNSKHDEHTALSSETAGYINAMNFIVDADYDIVHNHSLHYVPIILGNLLDAVMVTSLHTPIFKFLELGALSVREFSKQTFTTVSASLRATWSHLTPDAKVVYNGIDMDTWPYVESPVGDYLFWYGRICPEKGTHLAIAAAIAANEHLILAGPKSNMDYYTEEVAPLLDHPNIEYIGHIEQESIKGYLGHAKATLFTSVWEEPYGLVIAESLACGTPVIAFEKGAARELLTETTGIVLSDIDETALCTAMKTIGTIDRRACRERAETFCSHWAMVRNYVELYYERIEANNQKALTA